MVSKSNSTQCSSHNGDSKCNTHNKPYVLVESLESIFLKNCLRTRNKNRKLPQTVINNLKLKRSNLILNPVMQTMTDEPLFSKAKISNHRLKGKLIMTEI